MSKNEEKENIYCVYCGEKNDALKEKCIKCNKTLHPKNQLFKEFLYNHIKSDLRGKLNDSIFSYLKNYIISHLYGILMTASIAFTAITMIGSLRVPYKTISKIDEIKKVSDNSTEVVIKLYTYDDSCWGDFDPQVAELPFTTAGAIVSGNRMTTQEIKIKKGTSLNDYCKDGHEIEMICAEELIYYTKEIENAGKKYREKILDYASWVHKNGTSDDKEYARRNNELEDLAWELMRTDNRKKFDKNQVLNESIELLVPELGCSYWS